MSLMDVILASNSPRRRQLLRLTGLDFGVLPADVDESPLEEESAPAYVQRLATNKARAVAAQAGPGALVIAADTTVVDGSQILGKPVDAADARRMLRQLRGRTHQVVTAIALLRDGRFLVDCCASDVPMRAYSEAEIQAYVASGDPLDKAGAYAIQHAGFHPVESPQGCYATVVGLPLCHLARSLWKFEIELAVDMPGACQSALGYDCPVYELILRENL